MTISTAESEPPGWPLAAAEVISMMCRRSVFAIASRSEGLVSLLPGVEVAADGPTRVGGGVLPGTLCSDIAIKKLDCHYTLTPWLQAIEPSQPSDIGSSNSVDTAKVAGETAELL